MDNWGEYYKNSNNNSIGAQDQNARVSLNYYGNMGDYSSGDNMAPQTFDECFTEITSTSALIKWTKIFKICSMVVFVILTICCFIAAYDNSYITVAAENAWSEPTEKFSMGLFIAQLVVYGVLMFFIFLSYKLTCAVLNCVAQITRNTGISAKLAAFNVRNQMEKKTRKEKDKKEI